jgi:hypothetical protein
MKFKPPAFQAASLCGSGSTCTKKVLQEFRDIIDED